jgi:hypothetical protein
MKFALAFDLNEAGGFEFLDVVREGGGRDGKGRSGLHTPERTRSFGNALEEFKAAWICEGLEEGCASSAREARGLNWTGRCDLCRTHSGHSKKLDVMVTHHEFSRSRSVRDEDP